jgi:hypothetical protein
LKLDGDLLKLALRNPDKVSEALKRNLRSRLAYDRYYTTLREPKTRGLLKALDTPEMREHVLAELRAAGLDVRNYVIDVDAYRQFFDAVSYGSAFREYASLYAANLAEKSLEHFVAAALLGLEEYDVYIDVASEFSPVPEIYARLYGCKVYRQDLAYAAGIHGDRIGGDAAHMPVTDGFATKMALHCSFEHFEGDADSGFISESARVLRSGGRLCIVPLYLNPRYLILTNPCVSAPAGVRFDDDALLYCIREKWNRFGRHYDVAHLLSRVRDQLHDASLTIYAVQNCEDVDPGCYLRFAALITAGADAPASRAVQ